MKLWIDDIREAPTGWFVARDSHGAIEFLSDVKAGYVLGVFEEVSFDHDLGGEDTTRRVMTWMIENDIWPRRVFIHTANPVGRQWLLGTARRYAPGWVEVAA